MKVQFKPGNMIYPLPAVLVSCGTNETDYNLFTVAWTGTICTNPPMCYISVRPERHSHHIISETREFVINLTTENLAFSTDWCGVRSGRDYDKFSQMHLTPEAGQRVKAPIIKESPVNIECKVVEIKHLGSHDMFIAEVVNVQVEESLLEQETGRFRLDKAHLISYSHGHYYEQGHHIGKFGWTVEKRKPKKHKS